MFATIFFTVLIILVIVLAISTIKIVKQSEVIIVERLGKYRTTGESGLNIVVPILDRVVKRIDLRTQVIDSPPQP